MDDDGGMALSRIISELEHGKLSDESLNKLDSLTLKDCIANATAEESTLQRRIYTLQNGLPEEILSANAAELIQNL